MRAPAAFLGAAVVEMMVFGRPLKAYFSVHDVGHLHALCGLYVLCHALLRLAWWVETGRCSFGPDLTTLLCLLPHVGLSLTGMVFFPLPAKRNVASPLLWPEGRLHSVIFAARSYLACLLIWLSLRTQSAAWLYLRGPPVLATCLAADWATAKYGSRERTTMRGMPWGADGGNPQLRRLATLYYSVSQLAATKVCFLSYRSSMSMC